MRLVKCIYIPVVKGRGGFPFNKARALGNISKETHMVMRARVGVMMNEWNGMIDGCSSDFKDLMIFISFHLSSEWIF